MQMLLKSFFLIVNAALLLFLASHGVPALATMYKWVDDQGVTHYGDSIPPEYRNRANEELNQRGVVIKKNDAALTPEQIKARDAELAKRKQATEESRRDAVLLGTYSSAEEIDLARDRNLKQIELVIKDTQAQLKSVEDQLKTTRRNAAAYAHDNQPVPDGLQGDIQILERSKQDIEVAIVQKRADAEALRARFEEDKKRYIELTERASGSAKPASTSPALTK
jgi:chromosome segregation ATPase